MLGVKPAFEDVDADSFLAFLFALVEDRIVPDRENFIFLLREVMYMYWDFFLFIGGASLALLWRIGVLLWGIRDRLNTLVAAQAKKDIKNLADELFQIEYNKMREEALRRMK